MRGLSLATPTHLPVSGVVEPSLALYATDFPLLTHVRMYLLLSKEGN